MGLRPGAVCVLQLGLCARARVHTWFTQPPANSHRLRAQSEASRRRRALLIALVAAGADCAAGSVTAVGDG